MYGYRFFEIICPNCGHQFVWLEHSCGSSYKIYRRQGFDEELESTKCPKCDFEMAVLKNSSTGIDISDPSLEVLAVIRGI